MGKCHDRVNMCGSVIGSANGTAATPKHLGFYSRRNHAIDGNRLRFEALHIARHSVHGFVSTRTENANMHDVCFPWHPYFLDVAHRSFISVRTISQKVAGLLQQPVKWKLDLPQTCNQNLLLEHTACLPMETEKETTFYLSLAHHK